MFLRSLRRTRVLSLAMVQSFWRARNSRRWGFARLAAPYDLALLDAQAKSPVSNGLGCGENGVFRTPKRIVLLYASIGAQENAICSPASPICGRALTSS